IMVLTKLKIGAAMLLCAGLSLATVGGMLAPAASTKDADLPASKPIAAAAKSATGAEDAATADPNKLEGEWQVVEAVTNGKKAPSEEVRSQGVVFTFKDDEITMKSGSVPGRERKKMFKLHPQSSPKGIDITSLDVQKEGETA